MAADGSGCVKRFVRASRVHPDAGKQTVRMPFAQLRSLVIAAIEGAEAEREFDDDSVATTYKPRTRTLDRVLASLSRER